MLGNSFDNCLENLRSVLVRCEETNLMLNWEKCHFMVQEGNSTWALDLFKRNKGRQSKD